jgi:putative colanic acid biosynthesis acetyltransferase WcaB
MQNFSYKIFQDWSINRGNPKAQIVLSCYRFAHWCKHKKIYTYMFCWYLLWYRLAIEWGLGIEINWNVKAGPNLRFFHGQGLILNSGVQLGKWCILRQGTTIGNKQLANGQISAAPIIGDSVDIGANVIIVGPITIGNNAVIGAGSIVLKDIGENEVWAGNPAKFLKMRTT